MGRGGRSGDDRRSGSLCFNSLNCKTEFVFSLLHCPLLRHSPRSLRHVERILTSDLRFAYRTNCKPNYKYCRNKELGQFWAMLLKILGIFLLHA